MLQRSKIGKAGDIGIVLVLRLILMSLSRERRSGADTLKSIAESSVVISASSSANNIRASHHHQQQQSLREKIPPVNLGRNQRPTGTDGVSLFIDYLLEMAESEGSSFEIKVYTWLVIICLWSNRDGKATISSRQVEWALGMLVGEVDGGLHQEKVINNDE